MEDCKEKLPCPRAFGDRLPGNVRFRSLGVTTSQVIAVSKIVRDVAIGRCHGPQEGRIDVGFFASLIVWNDKSMVKLSFLGVLTFLKVY